MIFEVTNTPLMTIPLYQMVMKSGSFKTITEYDLVQMIRISSVAVHVGFNLEMLEKLRGAKRNGHCVQGRLLHICMDVTEGEREFFLSRFDEMHKIPSERSVVLPSEETP
jgi:thiamine biosynthesis protein ThiC